MPSISDNEDVSRLVLMARRCLQKGDLGRAQSLIDQAKTLNPHSSDLLRLIEELEQRDSEFCNGNVHSRRGRTNSNSNSNSNRNPSTNQHSTSNGYSSQNGSVFNERNSAPYSYSYKGQSSSPSSSAQNSHSHPRDYDSASASASASHTDRTTTSSSPQFTQDQLKDVQRIRRSKDYYEILQVEKTSTEEDVKRAYKKLAVKLHPDKNKAPGATDAFRAVSNAFYVLSDSGRRREYDSMGSRVANTDHSTFREHSYTPGTHRRRRRHDDDDDFEFYDYTRGFESDMSAEEIFNMFFGNVFGNGPMNRHFYQTHSQTAHRHSGRPTQNALIWLQFSPILILFLVSFLTIVFRTDPPYSLNRTPTYNEARRTDRHQVQYYIRQQDKFDEKYPANSDARRRIEHEIESEHVAELTNKCFYEENQRGQLLYKARWTRDNNLYQYAENMKMPACDELRHFRSLRGY